MGDPALLAVHDVRKRFGDRDVLRGVAFRIEAGEVLGLLGGNGAGKSTTVNIIAGLLPPDAGVVEIGGRQVPRHCRRMLGVALQEPAVYPILTVAENLRFAGRLYGLTGASLQTRVSRIIADAGMTPYRDTRAAALSGGWRHRLNVAAGLVHEPTVVLLDEPTAGMDVEARGLIARLLQQVRARGAAVLVTTHLLEEAEVLCDRVAIMHKGRVAAEGTLDALRPLVPARELAAIHCRDRVALRARARARGYGVRDYDDGRLTLLLPERTTVAELADELAGVDLSAVALQPIGLRHIYHEIRHPAAPA